MLLSSNEIYNILGLENPDKFEKERITSNLFYLNLSWKETDIYRQTGRTTRLMVKAISYITDRDRHVFIRVNNRAASIYTSGIIISMINKIHDDRKILLFTREYNNEKIIFNGLNSSITIQSSLESMWMDYYDADIKRCLILDDTSV